MTVIHANDTTTSFLSQLYELREDVLVRVTEEFTKGAVRRAICGDDTIMMLGHGTEWGLLSKPDKNGRYERLLVDGSQVQFLRSKTCIAIWCHADRFALKYGLHGLFSGMIISELQEAMDYGITATREEIDTEMQKFTLRLRDCIERYGLKETPGKMKELDDVKSALTTFNYNNLYYFE